MNEFGAGVVPCLIDGARVSIGGAAIALVRPSDGAVVGTMLEAGSEGVAAAVASAKAAFEKRPHSALHERAKLLHAAAAAIAGAAVELADLVCEDIGKPIRSAKFEVGRGADLLRACAEATTQFAAETVPLDAVASGSGTLGFVQRVPYGVVGAITPFNAPVNLLLQKVGPAIAAGN